MQSGGTPEDTRIVSQNGGHSDCSVLPCDWQLCLCALASLRYLYTKEGMDFKGGIDHCNSKSWLFNADIEGLLSSGLSELCGQSWPRTAEPLKIL